MLKFFSGLIILFLVLFLQFQLASTGIYFNLSLAALIAFAFTFDFLELLCLDLAAIFLLNWQPSPSGTLIIFFLIPLIVFGFRKFIRPEPWLGNLAATFLGFLTFYLILAPSFTLHNLLGVLADIIVALAAGELIFFALRSAV